MSRERAPTDGTRPPPRPLRILVAATAALVASVAPTVPAGASPGLSVTDLTDEALSATDLAEALAGEGVTVSGVSFTGAETAAGVFSGGGTGEGAIVGFEEGILLSTGAAVNVVGPNEADAITTDHGTAGDADLDALLPEGAATRDAAVLGFDFVPSGTVVTFRYVFSSDEYNEFVGVGFNDVFGFFVNGENCATVNGDPVSIDSINLESHSDLYRNNERDEIGSAPIDTEMDGLTVVLACQATVKAGETNTMKLAIADVGDGLVDSNVFIEAGSLTTEPLEDVPGPPQNVAAFPADAAALLDWDPPTSGGEPDIYEATCTATDDPEDRASASVDVPTTEVVVEGLTNGTTYTCTVRAGNEAGFGPDSDASNPVTPSADANAAAIDAADGGTIEWPGSLGTSVAIEVGGGGSGTVIVSGFLFGAPGEVDPTCGGRRCVGQGIEWALSDPGAVTSMEIVFTESPVLVEGLDLEKARVYKDGQRLKRCKGGLPRKPPGACVLLRELLPDGAWRVTVLANPELDPKGRI
ncbi:MAG TPA: choice-of-anchor L domain-containing protein [Actinomycetota bacterium]|nr:choice-of-anchor L domain-containing protein [Actinomycetota bacterium]